MKSLFAGWQENRRREAVCNRLLRMAAAAALLLALGRFGVPAVAQDDVNNPDHDAGDMPMPQTHEAPPGAPSIKPGEIVPPPKDMSFTTRLDHTAIWVGDVFHYTVVVEHSPAYEFVLDTLGKDTVNMDPFQVLNITKNVENLKSGNKRLTVDLALTCFTTGKPAEKIPQLTLFYFKREGGAVRAEESAAEGLTVPGPEIGLRTTLPTEPQDIRDQVTYVYEWPKSRWVFGYLGYVALIALVIGVGVEGATLFRRRKQAKGPDRRKAMQTVRDRWLDKVPGNFSDPEAITQFYDQSYQNLKEYVGYYLESPAMGLTAEEVKEEMERLGTDHDVSRRVGDTLGTLETARYYRNGGPSPDAAQRTAQEIREIFSLTSK